MWSIHALYFGIWIMMSRCTCFILWHLNCDVKVYMLHTLASKLLCQFEHALYLYCTKLLCQSVHASYFGIWVAMWSVMLHTLASKLWCHGVHALYFGIWIMVWRCTWQIHFLNLEKDYKEIKKVLKICQILTWKVWRNPGERWKTRESGSESASC